MMTQKSEIIVRNIAISTRDDQYSCRSPGRDSTTETVQYHDLAIVFKHDALSQCSAGLQGDKW